MAGLLLVSQIAMAGESCMLAAMAGSAPGTPQAMSEDGCESMPIDAAACRVRCLEVDQTQAAGSPDQHFHAVSASAAVVDAIALPAFHCSPPSQSATQLPGGPPLRILHCSYQF
jgi:hypothetical protein